MVWTLLLYMTSRWTAGIQGSFWIGLTGAVLGLAGLLFNLDWGDLDSSAWPYALTLSWLASLITGMLSRVRPGG